MKNDKKKLENRLNAIKGYLESKEQQVSQDLNNLGDNFFDSSNTVTHKLGAISNDSVKKLPKSNVYENLIELLSRTIANDNLPISNGPSKLHLKSAALQAMNLVGQNLNEIVRDEFMKGLYVSTQLGCGVDSEITATEVRIKPSEFDLLGMLKISPNSKVGKAIYETEQYPTNRYSMNSMFYTVFSGGIHDFYSKNNELLFSIEWDKQSQEYLFTNILNKNVYNFIVEYFITVVLFERKNLFAIITSLLAGVISIDRNPLYLNNLNIFNRLISKILSYCNEKSGDELKSDNMKEFEDLPYDVIDLFDFDDVEGLFREEEQFREKGVLKFVDCNNLETQVDVSRVDIFIDDFERNDNGGSGNNEYVTNFLNDLSYNAFQDVGGTIPLELLKINLNKNFIKAIPQALAHLFLTPKAIFPFVFIRRIFGSVAEEGKTFIKAIFKIVFRVIREIFAQYLKEFFRLVKKEIVRVISIIISDTIQELAGKRLVIIKQLLNLIRKLASLGDITSCNGLVSIILNLLSTATSIPFNMPTPLLIASTMRSGFSNIRAFINVVEELNKVGIPTGDIYGTPNKYVLGHLAAIKGVEQERSENSLIKSTIISGTVITPAGPGTFVPGTVQISGIIA